MPLNLRHSSWPKQELSSPAGAFFRLTVGLFAIGFLAGCLGGNLLREHLYEPVLVLFENLVNTLPSLEISRGDVFFYSMKENFKVFFLLVFFALTNVWRFYYTGFTVYTGFSQGLFCSFCIMLEGVPGILQYLCFLLPQAMLAIPVFIVLLGRLEFLHAGLFSRKDGGTPRGILRDGKKRQLVFSELPVLLLFILLLGVCALLEGYLNVPLLKFYHAR